MDFEYDVDIFLKEMALAEKAGGREQSLVHYNNAAKAFKGAFLPDLDFDWASTERERLQQMYMDALIKTAGIYLETHDFEASLTTCQRILKEDNSQEDAHRIAMRVHAAMGNRALVTRQYDQCRQALLDEVNAPPSYQTQALYESLMQ
jgi:two-component SAPR family response regulator